MKTTTYNYELAPTQSKTRADHQSKLVSGTLVANKYGTATQMASAKARELSQERGEEYGLVRIW